MSYDKRMPRTMQEAFGPYTSFEIHQPAPRSSKLAKVGFALLAVVALTGFFFVPR